MQLGDINNWRGHSAKEIGAGYGEMGGGVEGTKHERGAVNAENHSSHDLDMYDLADPDMYNSVQDAQKGWGRGGTEEDGFPRVWGHRRPPVKVWEMSEKPQQEKQEVVVRAEDTGSY